MSVNIHRSRVSPALWCHICSSFLISPANEVSPLPLVASSSLKMQQATNLIENNVLKKCSSYLLNKYFFLFANTEGQCIEMIGKCQQ